MTGNLAPRELAVISKPWTGYAEAEGFKTAYLNLLPLLHTPTRRSTSGGKIR